MSTNVVTLSEINARTFMVPSLDLLAWMDEA